jgi:hypothetical protein
MTFKPHVSHVISKLNSGLYYLRNARGLNLPEHSRFLIYNSLMHSHIMYGLCVYSSCTDKAHLESIQLKRKAAIRLIFGKEYLAHTEPLFKQANWLSLDQLIDKTLVNHIILSRSSNSPAYFENNFQHLAHNLNTRSHSSHAFSIPTANRTFQQRSVTSRAVHVWNSSPLIRQAVTSTNPNNVDLAKSRVSKVFKSMID